MKNKILKNMEWWILLCSVLLCIIGFIALYSATHGDDFGYLKKQLIWFSISFVIMIIMMFIEYETLAKLSPIFYGISIVMLIVVLFTKQINGASSWFNIGILSVQPSEIAKIAVVLFSSWVIVKVQENNKNDINNIWKLALVLLTVAVPVGLIILQPDYGTAAAYLLAIILMLFVAGIDRKYIFLAIIVAAIALPLIYMFVLPTHAKTRIEVFLNPESDPKGAGYNIIQSKLAIRSRTINRNGFI